MELIDSQAQLIQVNIEIHEDVWRQSRGEHFLLRKSVVSLSVKGTLFLKVGKSLHFSKPYSSYPIVRGTSGKKKKKD